MGCNCGGSSGAAPEPADAPKLAIKYQPPAPLAQTQNPNDAGFFAPPGKPKPARQQA